MRILATFSVVLSLLDCAWTAASSTAGISKSGLSSTFEPPQVFKNVNLVHVVSVEKNYVKESINVLIENIDKVAQDEYYLPFTSDQISRLGGFEVKDRKDANSDPFTAEVVELDQTSDTQFYRIKLPTPLKAGAQQTLGISYYMLKAYSPLPASINQDENQFLTYTFSVFAPSAYVTTKQKTEVKASSSNIPDYTKIPGSGSAAEFPQKQSNKLTYGPFDEKPVGAIQLITVRFEFTKPINHVAHLERDIEVSHWGGNVAFEERYTLYHRGANLSNLFNRVKWAQHKYYNPNSYALEELRFPLRVGSKDPYYTDVIGNVSTSRFRSNKREALLECKPRYPIFGGWKYPFTIGWNSDAKRFLRKSSSGSFLLNVPFLEGPKQVEGTEYEQVVLRVILPEGAKNVNYTTTIPRSSITQDEVVAHKTFLDTLGRTVLILKARNLVDDFRDRELIISYDYSFLASIRKPVIVFASMVGVFVSAWLVGSIELKFSSKKQIVL